MPADTTAPVVTAEGIAAAVKSGELTRFYPVGFDQGLALSVGGRSSRGWGGAQLRGGLPDMEGNRNLTGSEWWGAPGRIGVVEKMVREEPTLQAMRLAMTLPLMSGTWGMLAPEDPTPQEQEATDFADLALFEHLDSDGGWHGWLEQAVQYQWRGFTPSEPYWPYDRELKRTLLGLKPLMPWTVKKWVQEPDERYGLEQWPRTGDLPPGANRQAVALTADELLNLRYMPAGGDPAPMGAFRPSYGDYMAASTYRVLESQGFSRASYGVPTIEVDPTVQGFDGTQETIDDVNLAAQNYRADFRSAMMFPKGYKLTFQEFPFRGDMLREAITAKRHSMGMSVLATFLRTGETKGALSLHDGQVLFFTISLQQAANMIARALSVGRHAPIKLLIAKNFPDVRRFPTVQPPEIRIGDPAALVTAIVDASSKGVLTDPDRGIEDRIREVLSLPGRPEPVSGPLNPDEPDPDDEVDDDTAEEQEAPPKKGAKPKPADDEVEEDVAEEQGQSATIALAAGYGDRVIAGPRGRALRACEEAVRFSETRGKTDAGKEEQARIIYEWRQRIAEPYGRELTTSADLPDAQSRPVPGQKALIEALSANLRAAYRAGGESVRNESDRIAADPELQKRIAGGDVDVGEGGDVPAPARLSGSGCGCGVGDPWLIRLSLKERMEQAGKRPDGWELAKKREVQAPPPDDDMPESDFDDIDPEDSIYSVAKTTATSQADKVRMTAIAALQAQGTGGALPEAASIAGIVTTSVESLATSSDMHQAQADVNTIFGLGRSQELRAEGFSLYIYSAMLESDSCDACLGHDGETFGADQLDVYATPAGWCEAVPQDLCNCITLGIAS